MKRSEENEIHKLYLRSGTPIKVVSARVAAFKIIIKSRFGTLRTPNTATEDVQKPWQEWSAFDIYLWLKSAKPAMFSTNNVMNKGWIAPYFPFAPSQSSSSYGRAVTRDFACSGWTFRRRLRKGTVFLTGHAQSSHALNCVVYRRDLSYHKRFTREELFKDENCVNISQKFCVQTKLG